MKYIQLTLTLLLIFSCKSKKHKFNLIEKVLQSEKEIIRTVANNADNYELQIMLTKINRNNSTVIFEDYQYHVNDSNYFYPASTVKLPVSILALEKINQQKNITLDTPFNIKGDTLITSFRKDITDIFAVSSNDTYNRLYEYLGSDFINNSLNSKGLTPVKISHRLSTKNAYNLKTKPLEFRQNDSTFITTKSIQNNAIKALNLSKLKKGIGFYKNDSLTNKPMDFSKKNYYPLTTQHNVMKRLMFPEKYSVEEQFKLNEKQRNFIIKSMALLPREVGYDPKEYYDGYVKFFLFGDSKKKIPKHIKIYNKVGYAYGYLTDCAYIKDTKHEIEYILSATIHVNSNKVYNDNNYEYESIGIPFLALFGRELHQYLINTKTN